MVDISKFEEEFKTRGLVLTLKSENLHNTLLIGIRDRLVNCVGVRWLAGETEITKWITTRGDFTSDNIDDYPLLKSLSEIDGMIGVTLVPYMVEVGKAEVFEWEDILPNVLETLDVHLTIKKAEEAMKND